MRSKKITGIIICWIIPFLCQGQIHFEYLRQSESKDFKEIVDKVEAYYKDKDKGRGSGYKQFKRWEYYNATRLSSDGKVIDVTRRNFNEFYHYQENLVLNASGRTQGSLNVVAGDWQVVGPVRYTRVGSGHTGGLGRINAIEVDPADNNIIYVGTPSGGLFRSVVGGNAWTPLTDGIPRIGISDIAIDYSSPANNRTIYVLTGDSEKQDVSSIGVFKSLDNGRTWYSTGLNRETLGTHKGYTLKIHPTNPNVLFVGSVVGIHKTQDGGLSWTITRGGAENYHDIEFKPGDPTRMYAAARNQIFISTDTGDSWVKSAFNPPSSSGRIELAVTAAKPNYVYAICGGNWNSTPHPAIGFNGVYRSEDSGLSFFRQSNEPNILSSARHGQGTNEQSVYNLAIEVSPTNPDEVHVGGINCWKSLDGGVTWGNTSYWNENEAGAGNYTHADIHDLKFVGSTLYCASDGGIYKSTDNASNWSSISNGLQITQVSGMGLGQFDGREVYRDKAMFYGAYDNGLNHLHTETYDNLHWEGADGFDVSKLINTNYVIGSIQLGALFVYNFKSHVVANATPNGQLGNFYTPKAVHNTPPDDLNAKSRIYVGYEDVYYFLMENSQTPGPNSWTRISHGELGPKTLYSRLAVAPSDHRYVYVSRDKQLFRTTNLGSTWSSITGNLPSEHNIKYIEVHPTNPNIVYVALDRVIAGQKIYRTNDGGATWTNISGALPNLPMNCIVYDKNSANGLYVGTDVGAFYRDDNIGDWVPFYHNLPNVDVSRLEINYATNEIYASTYGRGIWRSKLYGQSCESNVAITHDLDGFKYFTANNISSSSIVEPNADVNFVAANSIKLTTGFKTQPGAGFNAKIQPDVCSDGISNGRSSNERTGIYLGPLPGVVNLQSSQKLTDEQVNDLYVFPNPAASDIYLQFENQQESNLSINLFDIQGNKVLVTDKVLKRTGKMVEKLSVGHVRPGIYIIEVNLGNLATRRKVVIRR